MQNEFRDAPAQGSGSPGVRAAAAMMTPSEIVRHLDRHVVGQEDAKKILAVAVYSHFRTSAKAGSDSVELVKNNILLIGSTGTGKTLLVRHAVAHSRRAFRDRRRHHPGPIGIRQP